MASRRKRIKPQQDAARYINLKVDKSGLEKRFIDEVKGRGVFATLSFCQGDFVLEYRGRLLPCEHVSRKAVSEFVFDFKWKGQCWREPHLCMFALRDISPGEELSYNYGDADWPWRKRIKDKHSVVDCHDGAVSRTPVRMKKNEDQIELSVAELPKSHQSVMTGKAPSQETTERLKIKDKHSVVDCHDGAVSRTPVMMKKSEDQIELSVAELPKSHQSVMTGKAPSQETTERLKIKDKHSVVDCHDGAVSRTPVMMKKSEQGFGVYGNLRRYVLLNAT